MRPRFRRGIRYVITLDADTRLPIGAARRLVGKMAHPLNRPRFDPARRSCRARPRHSSAARDAIAAHRGRRFAVSTRVFRPNGLDPYALQFPTCIRICSTKAPIPARESMTSISSKALSQAEFPKTRCSATICWKGFLPGPASLPTLRSSKNFPRATTWRGTPAPLGARRLAVAALDLRLWRPDAQRCPENIDTADGALEDYRQSCGVRCPRPHPSGIPDRLATCHATAAEIWTVFIVFTIALPPLLPAVAGIVPRRTGISLSNHCACLRRDFELGTPANRFPCHFSCSSGVDDGRRGGSYALPRLCSPASFAGMGDRGAGRQRSRNSIVAVSPCKL